MVVGTDEKPSPKPRRLKKRADFQRAGKGRRVSVFTFQLQARKREAEHAAEPGARIGFTVTKKVGGSVVRNRIRRRLKAALIAAAGLEAKVDHDYVVFARRDVLARRFADLAADALKAFHEIGVARPPRPVASDARDVRDARR